MVCESAAAAVAINTHKRIEFCEHLDFNRQRDFPTSVRAEPQDMRF